MRNYCKKRKNWGLKNLIYFLKRLTREISMKITLENTQQFKTIFTIMLHNLKTLEKTFSFSDFSGFSVPERQLKKKSLDSKLVN